MITTKQFEEGLYRAQAKTGMTRGELAKAAGYTPSYVSALANRKPDDTVPPGALHRIASAAGSTVDALFFDQANT